MRKKYFIISLILCFAAYLSGMSFAEEKSEGGVSDLFSPCDENLYYEQDPCKTHQLSGCTLENCPGEAKTPSESDKIKGKGRR